MTPLPTLPDCLRNKVDYQLLRSTRIHRSRLNRNLWIKREDELSASISGSKLRKYASVIPFVRERKIEFVGMIGGPNSNNLVGLTQILRENGIKPFAFVREPADKELKGNSLLLNLLLREDEYRFIPRSDWNSVEGIATSHFKEQDVPFHLLKEGAFGPEALPGAMSLAESVIENEIQSSRFFNRIYIDCGTGLSAIGLILGLELLSQGTCAEREIVVTLIAEEEHSLRTKIDSLRAYVANTAGKELNKHCNLLFKRPPIAPRFGAINASLFQKCREIAKHEGLLMDPTYSVKHFASTEEDLKKRPINGEALFIFNGSALGLMGFQKNLRR